MENNSSGVNVKLVALIVGILLLIAAIVLTVVLVNHLSNASPSDSGSSKDNGPKVYKKYAQADAATLRSIIAEAYIYVMSDPNFVSPEGNATITLISLEEAARTGARAGYYSDVKSKSHPGAKLVVTVDSSNNIDAYFLTEEGKEVTMFDLIEMAEEYNRKEENADDFGSDNQSSSAKAKAGTDAANLRSVIAEAYINVMSDSRFVAPSGTDVKQLFSLEAASKLDGVTGYYSEVKCKTDPTAVLTVVIDSNNNVDAYFVNKRGEKLTLEYFADLSGTGNY